ncbi:hypothetical protein [Sanguibacter sp. Leaf3]|uniref:hypothetical protein n=1 Tax=Sanguibacter sp. Leaf3 TaxID=1736209 RepID=UPI0006F641B6|nr:hypothetical protein [Sanguibacter sp. Leaf3]KQT98452.1 hypothetical protein ASG53_12470 [Sanguibacter sp. Leaf3]
MSRRGLAPAARERAITPIVSGQNMNTLAARRDDDLIDRLVAEGVAFIPFFPLGGFTPLQPRAPSRTSSAR